MLIIMRKNYEVEVSTSEQIDFNQDKILPWTNEGSFMNEKQANAKHYRYPTRSRLNYHLEQLRRSTLSRIKPSSLPTARS